MVTSIKVGQTVWGRRWRQRPWRCMTLLLLIAMSGVSACDRNLQPPPPPEPEALYWDLELNQHAVTLGMTAPYDTLTLTAVPRNHRGNALAGLPAPTYTSTDIEHVLVTPGGQLVAVAASEPRRLTLVVATLSVNNLTHRDSVWVRVVEDPNPPVLTSFSIHPIPPDSARLAAAWSTDAMCDTLPLRATDVNGNAMDGLPVSLRFSDSTVATYHETNLTYYRETTLVTGGTECQVVGLTPGNVTIYGTTTAFGVTKMDTLPYRITWPLVGGVVLVPPGSGSPIVTFGQPEVKIAVGGLIFWQNYALDEPISVIFADPTNVVSADELTHDTFIPRDALYFYCSAYWDCGSGNLVVPPRGGGISLRIFPVPGTYDFSTLAGARAKIVVLAE